MGRFFRFRVLVDAETGRRGETASKGGFPSAGDCVSELASVTRRVTRRKISERKNRLFQTKYEKPTLESGGAGRAVINTHSQSPIQSPVPSPQSPIPSPQSPIPNPQSPIPRQFSTTSKSYKVATICNDRF
jgi:hypothetical protein